MNWNAPKTVTLTGVNDAVADGNQLYFVVFGATTSADNAYKTRILEAAQTDPLLNTRLKYLGFRADTERVMAAITSLLEQIRGEQAPPHRFDPRSDGRPVTGDPDGGISRRDRRERRRR